MCIQCCSVVEPLRGAPEVQQALPRCRRGLAESVAKVLKVGFLVAHRSVFFISKREGEKQRGLFFILRKLPSLRRKSVAGLGP
jgi:hypothetical protein